MQTAQSKKALCRSLCRDYDEEKEIGDVNHVAQSDEARRCAALVINPFVAARFSEHRPLSPTELATWIRAYRDGLSDNIIRASYEHHSPNDTPHNRLTHEILFAQGAPNPDFSLWPQELEHRFLFETALHADDRVGVALSLLDWIAAAGNKEDRTAVEPLDVSNELEAPCG